MPKGWAFFWNSNCLVMQKFGFGPRARMGNLLCFSYVGDLYKASSGDAPTLCSRWQRCTPSGRCKLID